VTEILARLARVREALEDVEEVVSGCPPYWTPADQAELDLLTHEFVRVAWAHRERCSTCRNKRGWCAPLADAFAELVGWRTRRRLASRAEHLRAEQMRELEPA
jgi:hypothetical protein